MALDARQVVEHRAPVLPGGLARVRLRLADARLAGRQLVRRFREVPDEVHQPPVPRHCRLVRRVAFMEEENGE